MSSRILLLLLLFSVIASITQGQTPEVGENCFEDDDFYHDVVSTRTLWAIDELYAVPVGVITPVSWDLSSEFEQQLLSLIQPPANTQIFAEACGNIWQNYFSDSADVIISLHRTITSTDKTLACENGVWILVSEETAETIDISDWMKVGDESFDVTDENGAALLQQKLDQLLNELNTQPGA